MIKILSFLFLLSMLLLSGLAQSANKVIVVPLGAAANSIEYTGTPPIIVNNTNRTISFNRGSDPSPASNMQPSLVVYCSIALSGVFPSRNSSNPLLGEIMYAGFNFTPRGWASCDGQLLSISSNTALFSLLGTIYGGDGRTTFALPDFRGRVPIHTGTGPGLTPRVLGQRFGSEKIQ